jgi:uridylate kinase
MNKLFVINIGGSILSPSKDKLFDFEIANQIKSILNKYIKQNHQFILCVGGGSLARMYQDLLKQNNATIQDQHEAGIAAINMNAVIFKSIFRELAEEKVVRYSDFDSEEPINFSKPILISAAGKPGHSSDWNTVKLALRSKVNQIINITNIDGVYTADPKQDQNAKLIPQLTWEEYVDLIGNPQEFEPGGHYPIDILATRLAMENDLKFFMINSTRLDELENILEGREFLGSEIKNDN